MKRVIILLTLLSIFIGLKIDVYATTYTDKFIISDVIDGIYYAKVKNGITEYRKAKFKRRISDNKIVYCIEPFVGLKENTSYKGYDYNYESILKMSKEDWQRISLLAYYGYGYPGHTDSKWYPITQILIWQTIDKEATFYYTKTYKGERTVKFTSEINELEKLVKNHFIKPSFDGDTYNMSISSTLTITDENNILSNYEVIDNTNLVKIENNKLIVNTTEEESEINITLQKKDKLYNALPIVYVSNTYQNVLSVGSYEPVYSNLKITVASGNIKITKKDADTLSIIPQGEASLIGTTYELYDENNIYIDKIVIGDDNTGTLNKVKYGNYKLIEKISGVGYQLDNKEYYFSINEENMNIDLELTNQVIKRKIKIKKYTEDENKLLLEENIKFQIYNNNGEIIKEITTDNNGEIEFELPYGTYIVKQVNTTDGYQKVEDFEIKIDETSDELIEFFLYDLKIPNTSQKDYTKVLIGILFTSIITLIILKKYGKKYY